MAKQWLRVTDLTSVAEEGMYPFDIAGEKLLLVSHQGQYFMVENRCGHFGIPLDTGFVDSGELYCSGHAISFDLKTGQVANRPYENCAPIRTFAIKQEQGAIWVELDN